MASKGSENWKRCIYWEEIGSAIPRVAAGTSAEGKTAEESGAPGERRFLADSTSERQHPVGPKAPGASRSLRLGQQTSESRQRTSQSNGVQGIYAIDLNQDGRSELLELEPTATIGYRGNTVGLGLDSTTVTLAQLPTIPDAAAVADFDQDGMAAFTLTSSV